MAVTFLERIAVASVESGEVAVVVKLLLEVFRQSWLPCFAEIARSQAQHEANAEQDDENIRVFRRRGGVHGGAP